MKNIAIITARSGSKGLKDKNIKEINGKPLMAYSIEVALASDCFDEVMVSTDSERYAEIAKKYRAEVPFLRSEELSGDRAGSWETVEEVLYKYLELNRTFDTVCLLQPTSPLRESGDIISAYKLFDEKRAGAVTGVSEPEHSPLWCNTLPASLSMSEFRDKTYDSMQRQQLPVYYRINGAMYIRRIIYDKMQIKLEKEPEFAYIMSRDKSIDIDTEMDFIVAGMYLKRRNINNLGGRV